MSTGGQPPSVFSLRALQHDIAQKSKITPKTGYSFKSYLKSLPSLFEKGKLAFDFNDHEQAYRLLYKYVLLTVENLQHHSEYDNFKRDTAFTSLKKQAVEALAMVEKSQKKLEEREAREEAAYRKWEEDKKREKERLEDEKRRKAEEASKEEEGKEEEKEEEESFPSMPAFPMDPSMGGMGVPPGPPGGTVPMPMDPGEVPPLPNFDETFGLDEEHPGGEGELRPIDPNGVHPGMPASVGGEFGGGENVPSGPPMGVAGSAHGGDMGHEGGGGVPPAMGPPAGMNGVAGDAPPAVLPPAKQLATLVVAADLVHAFAALSYHNTEKGVETVAVVAGHHRKNEQNNSEYYEVSALIVPKQSGTSDSCDMQDDHQISEKLEELGLVSVGWIHTHPTQTAFLSSVDLHTHYSYQKLLDEAAAFVLAPTDPTSQLGIFRLTDEGMDIIGNCSERGFHEHPKNLFDHCRHIYMEPRFQTQVIDLRAPGS